MQINYEILVLLTYSSKYHGRIIAIDTVRVVG